MGGVAFRARAGRACGLRATPPLKMHLCRFETIEWPDCRANIDSAGIVGPVMGFSSVAPAGGGRTLAGAS